MPGKNAVDVYLAVGLRWRDFAQLEQHIFKAYYFLAATIQTISKTKTYVKNKLGGWRLSDLITLEWHNLNLETNYIDWKIQVKTKHGLELKVPLRSNSITHIFNTSLKVTGDNQSRQFLSQT